MVRAVVVEWSEGDCRLYRQSQWTAEDRRSPEATQFPRLHLNLEEAEFEQALTAWRREGATTSRDAALGLLRRLGAREIDPRGMGLWPMVCILFTGYVPEPNQSNRGMISWRRPIPILSG
jgi:hypothetical protein